MQEQVLEQDKGEMMKVSKIGKETMEMEFDEEAERKRKEWVHSMMGTDGEPAELYDPLLENIRYDVMNLLSRTVSDEQMHLEDFGVDAGPVEKGPSYYRDTKYEPRLVAKDWNLDPYLFNVMKYIKRCGLKVEPGLTQIESEIKDLNKAIDYIRFRIEELEEMKDDDYDDDY